MRTWNDAKCRRGGTKDCCTFDPTSPTVLEVQISFRAVWLHKSCRAEATYLGGTYSRRHRVAVKSRCESNSYKSRHVHIDVVWWKAVPELEPEADSADKTEANFEAWLSSSNARDSREFICPLGGDGPLRVRSRIGTAGTLPMEACKHCTMQIKQAAWHAGVG